MSTLSNQVVQNAHVVVMQMVEMPKRGMYDIIDYDWTEVVIQIDGIIIDGVDYTGLYSIYTESTPEFYFEDTCRVTFTDDSENESKEIVVKTPDWMHIHLTAYIEKKIDENND